MPFVQISLRRSMPAERATAVSDAVHAALVEVFGISNEGRFHTIQRIDDEHFFHPASYLDIPHTDNLVYVHITAKQGRGVELKQALYQAIGAQVAARAGVSADDVIICLNEVPAENWSFGGGKATFVDQGS